MTQNKILSIVFCKHLTIFFTMVHIDTHGTTVSCLTCKQRQAFTHLDCCNNLCSCHFLCWQVIYLRRFKQLQTINLAGNPISQQEEYRTFVIAHLPNLEYLDYRLVDQATVSVYKSKQSPYRLRNLPTVLHML